MARAHVLIACLVLGATPSRATAQPRSPHAVLMIHLGAQSFPSNPIYDAAIRSAILDNVHEPIEYFAEYLNNDLLAAKESEDAFADYIRAKYRNRRFDVVITIGQDGVRFAVEHRPALFPGVPIVYGGIYVVDERARSADGGITGVETGIAHAKTLEAALTMHPDTERVFVIANVDDGTVSDQVRSELSSFSNSVALTYLPSPTVAHLLQSVRAVPPRSLVLYIWSPGRETGNLVYPDAIAAQVAEASPVPVYGSSDLYVGTGIVGGVVRSTAETGRRMGLLAAHLLNGARAEDLPIETPELVPVFDWRQIQRWRIDPARLPPGTRLEFRTRTTWETYRGYIIGAIAVIGAQLALIAGLLTQRTHRQRAEATIRAREATIRQSYERTRQLAGRLLNAQEVTRAGIARDLHDGLCQDLANVTAALSELKESDTAVQDAKTQEMLSEIEEDTLGVYNQIRQLSHDLHPPTLRLLGLGSALKAHCREIGRRHGVDITYSMDDNIGRLDSDVETALFRIAQEAVRNAIVHGCARHLTVSLVRPNGHVELTVADDGNGFDVEAVRRNGEGLGLMSMDERAHVFGGHVEVLSRPAEGTVVRVRGA